MFVVLTSLGNQMAEDLDKSEWDKRKVLTVRNQSNSLTRLLAIVSYLALRYDSCIDLPLNLCQSANQSAISQYI